MNEFKINYLNFISNSFSFVLTTTNSVYWIPTLMSLRCIKRSVVKNIILYYILVAFNIML